MSETTPETNFDFSGCTSVADDLANQALVDALSSYEGMPTTGPHH